MGDKFTNIYGDGEISGQNPDAGSDYFELEDYTRDQNYLHAKIAKSFRFRSLDPTKEFFIISGGIVTEGTTGTVSVSPGYAVGKDANGNPRIIEIPQITNRALPSGWNDNRQIWVVAKYAYKNSSETRAHFNGETYHQVKQDTYVGDATPDDIFTDSDPFTSETAVVLGSFKMNGTTYADQNVRTRRVMHESYTIANDGTVDLPLTGSYFAVAFRDRDDPSFYGRVEKKGSDVVISLFKSLAVTYTANTASNLNIYVNSGLLRFQNKLGSSKTLFISEVL